MTDKIRKLAFVWDITLLREDDILPPTSLLGEDYSIRGSCPKYFLKI
jgi:hypothetical protein